VEKVFEEVDADEYDNIQEQRRADDSIVDDEGFGYKDNGGEIWEQGDDDQAKGKKKSRKLNVSGAKSQLNNRSIERRIEHPELYVPGLCHEQKEADLQEGPRPRRRRQTIKRHYELVIRRPRQQGCSRA